MNDVPCDLATFIRIHFLTWLLYYTESTVNHTM